MANEANSARWVARTGGLLGSTYLTLAKVFADAVPASDIAPDDIQRLVIGGGAFIAIGLATAIRQGTGRALVNTFAGAAVPPLVMLASPSVLSKGLDLYLG